MTQDWHGHPLIFVLLDGLNAATAGSCMSYMAALTEAGQARRTTLQAALPPLSRPVYAVLLTGKNPLDNGIVHNEAVQLLRDSVFHRARAAGLCTAAAAYYWMSELCNAAPFDPARHRLTATTDLPIQYGLFYSDDAYPDSELFRDAAALQQKFAPHFLLLHSMGIDWAGHGHGADSRAYRDAARLADSLLAHYLPQWLADGYSVLITADHGMDADHTHYDDSSAVRQVPLWLVGPAWQNLPLPTAQSHVAGLMLKALGLETQPPASENS